MPLTVHVTRIENGDGDLTEEQTFRIITEIDGERYDVKRTDSQLYWLMNSMTVSYPLSGHPPLLSRQGKLRTGVYDWDFSLKNEVICRFVASWVAYYLNHPTISKEALEPISTVSASDEEIKNIIKIPAQRAQPEPRIEMPSSLADSTRGGGLFGKMFSKFKGKKSIQAGVIDHASAALLRTLQDQQLLERERHEGLKAETEQMCESHKALISLFQQLAAVEEQMKKLSSTWTSIGKNLPDMKWWIGSSRVSVITPASTLTTPRDSAFAQRIKSRAAMKSRAQTTIIPSTSSLLPRQPCDRPLVTPRRGSMNLTATPRVSIIRNIPLPGDFVGASIKTVCSKNGYPNMNETGRLSQKIDYPSQPISRFPQEPLEQQFDDMVRSVGVYFNWMGNNIFSHSIGEAASHLLFVAQTHQGLHNSCHYASSLCQKISSPIDKFVSTVELAIEEHPGDAYFHLPVDGIEEVSTEINKLTSEITEKVENETGSIRQSTRSALSDICVGFLEQNIAALEREVDGWAAISELLDNDFEDPFAIPDSALPLEEKSPIKIPKLSLALSPPATVKNTTALLPTPVNSSSSPQTRTSSMMRDRSVDSFTLVSSNNPSPSPTSTVSARGSTASAAVADILNCRASLDYSKQAAVKEVAKSTSPTSASDSQDRESSPAIIDHPTASIESTSSSASPTPSPSPQSSRKLSKSVVADVYDDL